MNDQRRRVLVTGGNGVIGSWVGRELIRRGVEVVAVDVQRDPAVRFEEGAAREVLIGDLTDAALSRELLGDLRISRIIHLAAIVADPCEVDPVRAIDVNAVASARLLDAARERRIERVVAMSTKGVLGPLDQRYLSPGFEPVPPDLAPSPRSVYEASKYLVEVLVARHRAAGNEAAAFRLATSWGPGKTAASHGSLSMHSEVVARAAVGLPSQLDVAPAQCYDLVYYADVAAGLVDACLSDEPLRSSVYHLGSGRLTSMAEFASAVTTCFPGVEITLGSELRGGRNCLLDISRSTADFGYRPRYDVAQGLDDFAAVVARAGTAPGGPTPAA